MIAVSNEFKKAIKSDERRIKGYVEVIYDVPDIETTPVADYSSTYTNINEIDDGRRVENNYASLDYLPLDGTRLSVLDAINTNAGYISDDIFEDIQNPTIDLTFESSTIQGVTIYFKDNYPTNMTLEFSDLSSITVEPDNEIVQVIFDEPKTITSVSITINEMEYSDRKIKIQEIDLGISYVYQDQDLIEFTVDEEVNKLTEETPINETSITINNMQDLFNPLNPQGVVKYLSDGSKIIPHIGVLTETQGVEFVKMGEFYFDSYTNNSDKTTTLTGKNIIKVLETETLKDDNNIDIFTTVLSKEDFEGLMANYNYNYTYNENWLNAATVLWKEDNLLKFLKDLSFWQMNLFYGDRNSNLMFRKLDSTTKDTLTKNELLNDVEYKTIDKLNTLNIVKNTYTGSSGGSASDFLKETVTLSKPSEVFLIISNSPSMMFATVSQTGGTNVTKISAGFYAFFVRVTGNVGANVTLTFNGTTGQSVTQKTFSKQAEGTVIPKVLEFNSDIYYVVGEGTLDLKFPIIEKAPSYEINFEYNGDPSLEAGDYIEVETPYGYKPVFIQKNRFTFNGGLSGSIEGVE